MYIFRYYLEGSKSPFYTYAKNIHNVILKIHEKYPDLKNQNIGLDYDYMINNLTIFGNSSNTSKVIFEDSSYVIITKPIYAYRLQYIYNINMPTSQYIKQCTENDDVDYAVHNYFGNDILSNNTNGEILGNLCSFEKIVKHDINDIRNELEIIQNVIDIVYYGITYTNTKNNKIYKLTDTGNDINGNHLFIFDLVPFTSNEKDTIIVDFHTFKQHFIL